MRGKYNIIILYLRDRRYRVLIYSIFALVFFTVFYLYHLPLETILYATIICSVIGSIFIIYDFHRYYSKHVELLDIKNNITITMENLPKPKTLKEDDYQTLIYILYKDTSGSCGSFAAIRK